MKTFTKITSAVLLIAVFITANAEQNKDQALQALKSDLTIMATPLTVAHTHTETVVKDDESTTTINRITPSNNPKWDLLSVNGKTPTKKDLKKFKKRMKKQADDEKEDPFVSILNLESLTHFSSTDEFEIFAFDPVFSAFKEESKKDIDGRVYVDKEGVIQKIKINAPESFKPVFGATMNTFLLEYTVSYHLSRAYIEDHKLLIKAKVGGFKNLHMENSGTITDINWQ